MSFAWRLPWPYHYQTERSSLVMAFPRSLALLSPKLTLWPFCCLAELSWLYLLELPGLFITLSSSMAFLLPWTFYFFLKLPGLSITLNLLYFLQLPSHGIHLLELPDFSIILSSSLAFILPWTCFTFSSLPKEQALWPYYYLSELSSLVLLFVKCSAALECEWFLLLAVDFLVVLVEQILLLYFACKKVFKKK